MLLHPDTQPELLAPSLVLPDLSAQSRIESEYFDIPSELVHDVEYEEKKRVDACFNTSHSVRERQLTERETRSEEDEQADASHIQCVLHTDQQLSAADAPILVAKFVVRRQWKVSPLPSAYRARRPGSTIHPVRPAFQLQTTHRPWRVWSGLRSRMGQ